jgi:hypothetical protein
VDIVLGVSMTPTTVRMVLVEGQRADGLTIDHDVFDVTAIEDAANSSAPDQVISAILGTQQSAQAGGHRLRATGVTWSDHDEAARLREGLVARGIDDVMLLSDLHAAGALAQAAGRAVGYDKTALMFVERDTATLSVVETSDGSIVKVLTRSLHSADAMAVMTEMVTSLQAQDVRPGGMFVVGSGVDITSIKEHLEHLVPVPVSAPEDAGMALARGAALAAATAPRVEASTVGLAYSQDPDGPTAGDVYRANPAFVATQIRPVAVSEPVIYDDEVVADESRRPFLLVGSTLSAIFVIGVVALVISLAVSIRPTADQRPNPGESIVVPSAQAAAPPVAEQVQPPPVAAPAPPPETIKPPVPVVQEAPQQQAPRQVFVDSAPAPAAAPAPLPAAAPAPPPAAAPDPAPLPAAPAPPNYVPPYYPDYPAYYPNRPRWFGNRPPWVGGEPPQQQPWTPPQQQPPWTPPQQQPPWTPPQQPQWTPPQQPQWTPPQQQVIPQQPVATQQPLIPLLPVIQQPLFPQQPTLPPLPVVQDPVVPQQPSQPVIIQQPQQPSGPITRGPRGGNPFWPF